MGCLNRPLEQADSRHTTTVNEKLPASKIEQIDLLLMIDNSASMADKQSILAASVSDLVRGLVNPRCIDDAGNLASSQPATPIESCPGTTFREFEPVLDVHVGLISSSLGSHGADTCRTVDSASNDDHGHLLARSDAGKGAAQKDQDLPTYQGQGFLAWDPGQKLTPPGLAEIDGTPQKPGIVPLLSDMVKGVGQSGCGFESQLESWYRFLVDPEPYQSLVVQDGRAVPTGIDSELLAERKSFLRPGSLLAVVMLTDENDCSITESGKAFNAAQAGKGYRLPRARHECLTNVDDPCCKSCGQAPGECPDDPTCKEPYSAADDPVNLRCFDQKRRFGIDFLYPVDRYTAAITSATVPNRAGELVDNPLFPRADPKGEVNPRTSEQGLVFVAGIVGVPWEDIARKDGSGKPDLVSGLDHDKHPVGGFKSARELGDRDSNGKTGWDQILGDALHGNKPLDPLMDEAREPRSGMTPATGAALAPPTATSPTADPVNGHEWLTDKSKNGGDLQYACIFNLPSPKDCSMTNDCDCDSDALNPLCQDASGAYTQTQYRAKAYPGVRELSLLKAVGDQGIVASACPAQLDQPGVDHPEYGYRPAMGAVIERLKSRLSGACLHRPLTPDDATKQVSCLILEARKLPEGQACSCGAPLKARRDVQPEHEPAKEQALSDEVAKAAGWNCFCEIEQLEDDALKACQFDTHHTPKASGQPVDGWCYVDATTTPPTGDPALVAGCAGTEQHKLRFVGEGEPLPQSTLFITCSGE